jgi:hypothetical protein
VLSGPTACQNGVEGGGVFKGQGRDEHLNLFFE